MYAAYALSSIMTPSQPLTEMRAAGVIPALIAVLNTAKHLASKKGAMRALGRLARVNESAVEIVEANGLPPMIALLDCDDLGLVRRQAALDGATLPKLLIELQRILPLHCMLNTCQQPQPFRS